MTGVRRDARDVTDRHTRATSGADASVTAVGASDTLPLSEVEEGIADIPVPPARKPVSPSTRYSLMLDLKIDASVWRLR